MAASKKAFIVTRFADFFFLVGILLLSYFSGTFDFTAITDQSSPFIATMQGSSFIGLSVLSWAMILIFMGGAGKSAMMPFHIWLPDAMEGPTPASALIHAATMVVAGGVFLVARLFPVYVVTPYVLDLIAWVGAITALFAAVVACTQTDIKRVLAFSTISQIAFMLTSLGGVSKFGGHEGLGYMAGMFHLFTHAFFKALLFLCAGAIIHAVHSNEMGDMGGLAKKLPITAITFGIAWLAIAGIPPFSGFWSKDEILAAAMEHNFPIYVILSVSAGLTAFYMSRLFLRIFFYEKKHYHHEPHEAGPAMAIPLIILAVFAFGSGFVPFGEFITSDHEPYHAHLNWQVAITSVVISLIGMGGIAFRLYYKKNDIPDKITGSINTLYTWALHKFYFDELWLFVTRSIIFKRISKPIAWFDKKYVDGFMDSLAYVTQSASRTIKNFQSGYIQQYALAYLVGGFDPGSRFCRMVDMFCL